MSRFGAGVPVTPQSPMVDKDGIPTKSWYSFFVFLWQRTGGAVASASPILDEISSSAGSVIFRGPSAWQALSPAAQYRVLREGTAAPQWDVMDGNSFAAQAPNTLFSGPVSGSASVPTFRNMATTDLSSVAGAIPGIASGGTAAAGNVGEYVSTAVGAGAAVPLATTVSKDVASIALSGGDWQIWANIALSGGGSPSAVNAWISSTSAADPGAPNAGAYVSASTITVANVGQRRAGVAVAGATYYLSVNATFTGLINAYGFIAARRVR